MTPADRVGLLLLAALAVVVLVRLSRWWARRRLERLRETAPEALWQSLAIAPDERPLVVAFSSPGCAVCRTAQRPALRTVQQALSGQVRIVSVDVSERPRAADLFGVLTVPSTVVLTPEGRVVSTNHGFASTDRLLEQVRRAGALAR